jgi:oxygen-independent coproporphyrinogen-3 oxidase
MRPLPPDHLLPYPGKLHNLYIHIPFCSGVCDFCSYYLVAISPRKRAAIANYLHLAKQELRFHQQHTQLDVTYLYVGGGTPSLIPPEALRAFLQFLREQHIIGDTLLGTIELHPEFFHNTAEASTFLNISQHFGINRVSIGYQVSDEHLLQATKRRHAAGFITAAMKLLRQHGFLVNIDLIYGLPEQSLPSWEATLRDAVAFAPDSISTYFLFLDRGTVTYSKLQKGQLTLPNHRHIQTQHLMAQLYLESQGFHELPNDFYARPGGDPANFRPQRLPSDAHTLPIGPGAYGYFNNVQFCNVFDLDQYSRRVTNSRSPAWRGYPLNPIQSMHRDVIFALKNDPYLDCRLFEAKYNRSVIEHFAPQLAALQQLDLVIINQDRLQLTGKGRLCVEEISSLFSCPDITEENIPTAERVLLDKHNFAPTYPGL